MKHLLVIAIACICIASCARPKTDCYDPAIGRLLFTSANATDSITDDSVHLAKYTNNATFSELIYEYNFPLEQNGKSVQAAIPASVRADAYDWEIKLYPSGKTYRLYKIGYSNDQVKQHRYRKNLLICGNKIFYTVNNEAKIYDPQGPFSGVSLPITY